MPRKLTDKQEAYKNFKRLFLFTLSLTFIPLIWIALCAKESWLTLSIETYCYYLSDEPYGIFDGGCR